MSKVSLKNKLLPSFEPIEQKGTTAQKRKRAAALKDASSSNGGDNQPVTKKSKAKKNSAAAAAAGITSSAPVTKSVDCWIGATLNMKNEEEETKAAAFSIYYGLNDSRNNTERVTIQKNQTLDHVYTMGVIRALENYQDDDASTLNIFTGSKSVRDAIDGQDDNNNEFHKQIKQKIAKRKGSTFIGYKVTTSSTAKDEHQIAHSLANEKLSEEEDKMMVDDEETLVDSLEVTTTTTTTTTTVTTIETKDNDVKEEKTTIETEQVIQPPTPPTWAQTLNLRNLLDILKAPFYRKQQK